MTCIVGFATEAEVILGSDARAGDTAYGYRTRLDPKLVRISQFRGAGLLCGATGESFRPLQILSTMHAPGDERPSGYEYLVKDFVPECRRVLRDGGWASKSNEREWAGGEFLIGYRGALYTLWSDYSVAESALPYEAIGSGGPFALGALAALTEPADHGARVLAALEIAAALSSGVGPPFTLMRLAGAR